MNLNLIMYSEIYIILLIFSPDEKKKRKREEAEKKPDVSMKLTMQIHTRVASLLDIQFNYKDFYLTIHHHLAPKKIPVFPQSLQTPIFSPTIDIKFIMHNTFLE